MENTINKPTYVAKFLRERTQSESSNTSDFSSGSFPDMVDAGDNTTTTRPRAGSVNQIIRTRVEPQSPMRPRFGSVNSKDEIMETKKETALENVLYDKYLAK